MIKIFLADPMLHTPFINKQHVKFLNQHQIFITDDRTECDIIVSRRMRFLLPYRIQDILGKKQYLIWTHEPRFDTHFKNINEGFLWLKKVYIMNVYTGDIYLRNYTIYHWQINQNLPMLTQENFKEFKNKKVAALMLYRNNKYRWSLQKDGKELDLCYLRTRIALEGHKLNKIDIYGKGWPSGISIENSRGSGWSDRKGEILNNYHFNLCFENTNYPHYCTEKIWDSIRCGCLPIYYGNQNKIYEDFPKNSFLDYCDFKNPAELYEYIDQMDVEEFRRRMNLCIGVYNRIYQEKSSNIHVEEMLLKIVEKLKQITQYK
ncbi:MAG TPA: glycosyltransferase family 10 [Leptolyngbyaceae cyanobacterium]